MASTSKVNPNGNGFVSMEEFIRTRDSGMCLHGRCIFLCVIALLSRRVSVLVATIHMLRSTATVTFVDGITAPLLRF